MMYMREPQSDAPVPGIPFGLGAALAISLAFTIYLGVLPNRVLGYALQSAKALLP